jgi:hypothetical protein
LSIVEGLHVPTIPLSDEAGNEPTLAPAQIVRVVPKLNVGVVFRSTVTLNVIGEAQSPGVGVNV